MRILAKIGVSSLVWLLLSGVILSASNASAAVYVSLLRTQQANGVVYAYTVANAGDDRIVAVRIGFDYLHGVPELRTVPTDWTPESGIPSGSASSPQGWTALLVTTEESDLFDLEWTSDSSGVFDILPRSTLKGFSVRVPAAAAEYANASFDVVLGSGAHVHGRVELESSRHHAVSH